MNQRADTVEATLKVVQGRLDKLEGAVARISEENKLIIATVNHSEEKQTAPSRPTTPPTRPTSPETTPPETQQLARYYRVVGVSWDDPLNMREGPGTDYRIIRKLPLGTRRVQPIGEPKRNGDDTWLPIRVSVPRPIHPGYLIRVLLDDTTIDLRGYVNFKFLEPIE